MLSIVSTAIQFAAGYVAADRLILLNKKLKANRDYKRACKQVGWKPEFNYHPLFGG